VETGKPHTRFMNQPAAVLLVVAVAALAFPASLVAGQWKTPIPAPEFTHPEPAAWINSLPLDLTRLHGKVVLLDFWTFDCWNCYRSFPWLRDLEERYTGQGLQVIGVHTPEFDHEKVRANVVRKVKEFKLLHPIMLDNDHSYWAAMGNRYWPAFFLLDKRGRIRAHYVGETHKGDPRAVAVETEIQRLLAEPGP
jgi:thiol-disulfide isomerase/thioredoxin